jgi:hypothetical protein
MRYGLDELLILVGAVAGVIGLAVLVWWIL